MTTKQQRLAQLQRAIIDISQQAEAAVELVDRVGLFARLAALGAEYRAVAGARRTRVPRSQS